MQDVTVLTTVYAPDEPRARMACASLEATRLAFGPESMEILIDGDTGAVQNWALAKNCAVWANTDGDPPRMADNIARAVRLVETPITWTVESDVFVSRPMAKAATQLFRMLPEDVASLTLYTIDKNGRGCYPNNMHRIPPRQDLNGEMAGPLKSFTTWCCTAWRTDALKVVDWPQVPQFHRCDIKVGELMAAKGLRHFGTPYLAALHYPRSSRLGTTEVPDPSRAPNEIPFDFRFWMKVRTHGFPTLD